MALFLATHVHTCLVISFFRFFFSCRLRLAWMCQGNKNTKIQYKVLMLLYFLSHIFRATTVHPSLWCMQPVTVVGNWLFFFLVPHWKICFKQNDKTSFINLPTAFYDSLSIMQLNSRKYLIFFCAYSNFSIYALHKHWNAKFCVVLCFYLIPCDRWTWNNWLLPFEKNE